MQWWCVSRPSAALLSWHLHRSDHAAVVFVLEIEAAGDVMKSELSPAADAEGFLHSDGGYLSVDDDVQLAPIMLPHAASEGPLPTESSPQDEFAGARAEAMETQALPSGSFLYQGVIERNIYGWEDSCGRTKYEVKLIRKGEQVFSGFFPTLEGARQARECALVPFKRQVPQTLPLPHAAPGAAALSDAGARHDAFTAIDLNLKSPSAPLQPGAEISFPAPTFKTEHSPTKRPFSQTAHAGDVKQDFDRVAPADPVADTNQFACATHPTKRCIYLCINCRKAVCEICCMSSLNGPCRGHEGHLIEDIPHLIAKRHHQELNSFASTFHNRICAEQDRVLGRVKCLVQEMFSRFMSESLQQLHTECMSMQGATPEHHSLVNAAVELGGLGLVRGSGVVQLLRLVDGPDGAGLHCAYETALLNYGRECLDAASSALAHIDTGCFLPPPSAAAAALSRKFGPLYIFQRGYAYRALVDGWPPHKEGACTQENIFLPLPPGHEIAPDDDDSREVIARHPWRTRVMVVKSGCGYYTSCSNDPGTKFGAENSKVQSYLTEFAVEGTVRYSVFTSSLGILIRVPLHDSEDIASPAGVVAET